MEAKSQKIKEAIIAQLGNASARSDSPSVAVKRHLVSIGEVELANEYWWWVCTGRRSQPVFGEEVSFLQTKLEQIRVAMPDWGTYGT